MARGKKKDPAPATTAPEATETATAPQEGQETTAALQEPEAPAEATAPAPEATDTPPEAEEGQDPPPEPTPEAGTPTPDPEPVPAGERPLPYKGTVAVSLAVLHKAVGVGTADMLKAVGTLRQGAEVTVTARTGPFAQLKNGLWMKEAFITA